MNPPSDTGKTGSGRDITTSWAASCLSPSDMTRILRKECTAFPRPDSRMYGIMWGMHPVGWQDLSGLL